MAQRQVTQTGSYDYLLFLPERYEVQEQWPLILFLHGAGERGANARVREKARRPQGQYWSVPRLSILLDEISSSYHVDPDRVYLTGISMGGYGTWRLAAAQPHRESCYSANLWRWRPL